MVEHSICDDLAASKGSTFSTATLYITSGMAIIAMRLTGPGTFSTNLLLLGLLALGQGNALPSVASTAKNTGGNALLVIDVQGCFLPGGALPVDLEDTQSLITNINSLRTAGNYDVVIFTQDYHPANHVSFAAVHNKQPVDVMQLQYAADASICGFNHLYPGVSAHCNTDTVAGSRSRRGDSESNHSSLAVSHLAQPSTEVLHSVQQVLWPEHCIHNTPEVSLHPGLLISPQDVVIRKGWLPHLDAYSSFKDNGRFRSTGLAGLLRRGAIRSITVVGVALEYCVLWSALDAREEGFDTTVVLNATAPVSAGRCADAIHRLQKAGVHVRAATRDVWMM